MGKPCIPTLLWAIKPASDIKKIKVILQKMIGQETIICKTVAALIVLSIPFAGTAIADACADAVADVQAGNDKAIVYRYMMHAL